MPIHELPGNPWIYPGHERDEEELRERLLSHRRRERDERERLQAHQDDLLREASRRERMELPVADTHEAVPMDIVREQGDLIVNLKGPGTREITLVNLGKTEYTLYWVNGNQLIMSLDDHIHEVVMHPDTLSENQHLTLHVRDGFRYYLVPTYIRDRAGDVRSSDIQVDDANIKEVVYLTVPESFDRILTLDIHEGIQGRVFASEQGWDLSETHQWKFHALKLNYLLQQVIKLGGMANDNLAPVLDLHQDIHLPAHSEVDKEYAGIPSEFTNLT